MKRILALSAIAAALYGCNSSTPGDEDKYVAFNIVTYEGTSDDGVTTLSYQVINDSPLLTLTCNWTPDRELTAGTRLLVAYSTDTPTESGSVNLLQASLVYGGALEVSDKTDSIADSGTPLWITSMWRSGHYLNLDCQARYASGGRKVRLVADDSTLADDYPVLYLVNCAKGEDDMSPYNQRLYGSWDVDTLWSRPTVMGLTVVMDDSNRGTTEMTFSKQSE